MMPCNLSLKPGAVILGAVIAVAGVAAAIQVRRYESGSHRVERSA